jgi:DNA-binding MarR family transcriptional regulator
VPNKPATPRLSRLEDHLGFWLRFVSNHVSERFRQQVEATGVSVSEWVALRTLHDREASAAELVDALGMTKGAVSKILGRLETKGLLVRSQGIEDRRSHHLRLTATGRKLVPELARLADENDDLFFGHLSASARAELGRAMKDIVRRHGLRDVPVD